MIFLFSFPSIEKLSEEEQYRRDSFKVSAKRYGCQRWFDMGQVFLVLTSLERFFSSRIRHWNFRLENIVRSSFKETSKDICSGKQENEIMNKNDNDNKKRILIFWQTIYIFVDLIKVNNWTFVFNNWRVSYLIILKIYF